MFSASVTHDKATIPLSVLPTDRPVIWNCKGERRLIPKSVIVNAHALLKSYHEAVMAGVIEKIPEDAQRISWDSTLSIPRPSSRVVVASEQAE